MKKSIGFLCCTLLLGITFILNTEGELPLHWLRPFFLYTTSLECSKAVLKDRCLIFLNVKGKFQQTEFHCPKIWLRFQKNGIVSHLDQASLRYGTHTFSHVCGVFKKQPNGYKSFLTLNESGDSKIRVVSDPLTSKTFQTLSKFIHSLDSSSKTCFIQGLKIHIAGQHIYEHIDNFKYGHLQANDCYGHLYFDGTQLKCLQKAEQAKYQNICVTSIKGNGTFHSHRLFCKHAYIQARTTHDLFGSTIMALDANNIMLNQPISAYIQMQNDTVYAEGYFSDLKQMQLDKSFVRYNSNTLSKALKWLQPYHLSFRSPLYLKIHGNQQHLTGIIEAKDVSLQANKFQHIHSILTLKNQKKITWDSRCYADSMHPKISGFYDINEEVGEIAYVGHITPELTYVFNTYLPDGWEPFLKPFHFYKDHPFTDFSVLFSGKNKSSTCFGYVSAKDIHFKQSSIDQFHINFGNCPGYCWLRINDLKMNQKRGHCEIHWPYIFPDSQKERWIFNGNGNFKAHEWMHLLKDFIGEKEVFNAINNISENAEVQAKFEGIISSETHPKDHLTMHLNVPKGDIFDFPVTHFKADYFWNPHSTRIKNIQALLSNTSPIQAGITWQSKHFKFRFKGQHILTKALLKHPMIQPWTKAIPKDNLPNYDGFLDLNLQGQGKSSKTTTVSGHGHLEFQNPHLSQIHLLGPLNHLFAKKFKDLSSVLFDKLVSDFSFTEHQISTQKSTLLGPSTRADLQGKIDLLKQNIQGEIHFSFLDYQQLSFPIMKHFLQIFQPISKGFSAKISGTLGAPQWRLSFNPLRFVLPK